jgi:hypothetical protein
MFGGPAITSSEVRPARTLDEVRQQRQALGMLPMTPQQARSASLIIQQRQEMPVASTGLTIGSASAPVLPTMTNQELQELSPYGFSGDIDPELDAFSPAPMMGEQEITPFGNVMGNIDPELDALSPFPAVMDISSFSPEAMERMREEMFSKQSGE